MHGNMNVKFIMAFVKLVIHYNIGGSLTITDATIYSNERGFRSLSAMCYLCIHLYELSCICLFVCLWFL